MVSTTKITIEYHVIASISLQVRIWKDSMAYFFIYDDQYSFTDLINRDKVQI